MAYAADFFRNKIAPSALVALGLEAGIGVLAFVMLTHIRPIEKPAPQPVEITLEKAPEVQPEQPKPEPPKPQPQKQEPPKPQKVERAKPQPVKTRPRPLPPKPVEQAPQPVASDQSAFAESPVPPAPPEPIRQPAFDPGKEAKLLDEFQAKAREAIQAVMRYPAIARTLKAQGRVKVEFDYMGGVVGNAHVTGSSGHEYFDQAALEALSVAVLPPMPPELASKFRHLSINLDFYYRP